jgi:hypothetical protein
VFPIKKVIETGNPRSKLAYLKKKAKSKMSGGQSMAKLKVFRSESTGLKGLSPKLDKLIGLSPKKWTD